MLSSLDVAIVVFVTESSGCIKQALLKWAQKCLQLFSISITHKRLRGHVTLMKGSLHTPTCTQQ